MNDITNRPPTGLSTDLIAKLSRGIAESRASTVIAGGGKPLLRLLKDATWVFGVSDDEVQEGSSWAINPLSIAHGWVAWTNHEGGQKNSKVGEIMVSVTEPKPARPGPVDNWPFAEQRAMDLKCLDGEDANLEVTYLTSSVGGLRAVDGLLAEIQKQLQTDPDHPCPVVQLESDHYPHSKYGRITIPILRIVDWATMTGELASAIELPDESDAIPFPNPAKAEEPGKRTRKASLKAEAPAAPAAPAEPRPTSARATGAPRRRPSGR